MMALPNQGKSFGTILDENRGMGLGFDYLRLGLALLILLSHTSGIIGTSGAMSALLSSIFHIDADTASKMAAVNMAGVAADDRVEHALTGLGRPVTLSYLPMFFALSGFLVAGSALRTRKLVPFLGLRVLRLLPALFVEVTLSAIILGGILTSLPLDEYYRSAGFFNYFWNITGHVQLYLPGVFESTKHKIINENLWTLPWELYCYVTMSVIIISSLLYRPMVLSVFYVAVTVGCLIASLAYGFQVVPAKLHGPALIYYFLTGVMFYIWRARIPYNYVILSASVVVTYAAMMFPMAVFVYPVLLVYVTIFIGLTPFPQSRLVKSGDYSYGIYLYGFPVTQAIILTFPALGGNLALAATAATAATIAVAFLSWHGVEKHALKLKRYLSPRSSLITASLHPSASPESWAPEVRPRSQERVNPTPAASA